MCVCWIFFSSLRILLLLLLLLFALLTNFTHSLYLRRSFHLCGCFCFAIVRESCAKSDQSLLYGGVVFVLCAVPFTTLDALALSLFFSLCVCTSNSSDGSVCVLYAVVVSPHIHFQARLDFILYVARCGVVVHIHSKWYAIVKIDSVCMCFGCFLFAIFHSIVFSFSISIWVFALWSMLLLLLLVFLLLLSFYFSIAFWFLSQFPLLFSLRVFFFWYSPNSVVDLFHASLSFASCWWDVIHSYIAYTGYCPFHPLLLLSFIIRCFVCSIFELFSFITRLSQQVFQPEPHWHHALFVHDFEQFSPIINVSFFIIL